MQAKKYFTPKAAFWPSPSANGPAPLAHRPPLRGYADIAA